MTSQSPSSPAVLPFETDVVGDGTRLLPVPTDSPAGRSEIVPEGTLHRGKRKGWGGVVRVILLLPQYPWGDKSDSTLHLFPVHPLGLSELSLLPLGR